MFIFVELLTYTNTKVAWSAHFSLSKKTKYKGTRKSQQEFSATVGSELAVRKALPSTNTTYGSTHNRVLLESQCPETFGRNMIENPTRCCRLEATCAGE